MDLDEVLTLIVEGFDSTELDPGNLQIQSSLLTAVRNNAAVADFLVGLAESRTLRPGTVEMLIRVAGARTDIESTCHFVANLLSHPDPQIGMAAANAAFNMAAGNEFVRRAILEAVARSDASTDPQLAATLVRALRVVPSSDEVTGLLRRVLADGTPPAQAAALDVLGERTLVDVTEPRSETPDPRSSTSETVGRTDSRSIRLSPDPPKQVRARTV